MKRYVTSMSAVQYDEYGKNMLDSFCKYWPEGTLFLYSEDDLPIPLEKQIEHNIQIKRLQDVPGWDAFMRLCDQSAVFCGVIEGQSDYRFNARAFANKAFAQCAAANEYAGLLFWIDADTITEKSIPEGMLDDWIEGYAMCVMRRKTWHLCSSFVGWDCSHKITQAFFQQYYKVYAANTIFIFPEWHDAYILESMIAQCGEVIHDIARDITGESCYNVFDKVFVTYARHLKGALKKPMQRYGQLIEIVKNHQPKRIIEIGTWNGERALQMHKVSPDSEYIGFDLFEEATVDTDRLEKNVKKHFSKAEVEQKLQAAGMKFTLFKGDSKHTAEQYLKQYQHYSADLVFIDGGHSVETIRSDLAFAKDAIRENGIIVMDDYYTGMSQEELEKFGCQGIVEKEVHMVLPIKDNVQGGGNVQMVVLHAHHS